MYMWQQTKALRARGESIKKIARLLKLSKNTVRKYLRADVPPKIKKRKYDKPLDGYEANIVEMCEKRYIGTRIYEELKKLGYKGSLSVVHRYVARIKEEDEIKRRVTTRVETAPGKQMQYDWKEWRLPVGEREVKIYLHEVVLSYSRMKHYSYSLSINCQDVIRAIEAAVVAFGGTARELIFDNPKQMVIIQQRDRIVRYNDEFLKFCGIYGIEPEACAVYRARTKGKAERPFYYIQEHLLRGLTVASLAEFDPKLPEFTAAYNVRPHSGLGEPPVVRFEREKTHLLPVCQVEPEILYDREVRRVSNDGFVSYRGGYYPISMRLCLREVWVECISGRILRVYQPDGELISEPELRLQEDGIKPEHPEHAAMNCAFQEKKTGRRSAVANKFSDAFGDTGDRFMLGLRDREKANFYWHLSQILAYCDLYEIQEVHRAIDLCVEIGAYHKNSVCRLLDTARLKTLPQIVTHKNRGIPQADITRPLAAYAGIAEVGHE